VSDEPLPRRQPTPRPWHGPLRPAPRGHRGDNRSRRRRPRRRL